MTQPRRFFFVHLQKTAGTALLRRLRHQFGPHAVYPQRAEQGAPEVVLDVDRLQRRVAELGDQLAVVTGHFPLCTVELLPGPYATFTVLREPVERVLSFLRHQIDVDERFAGSTLEAVYADPVATNGLVANHMVRMLSLDAAELTDGALTPIDIDDRRLRVARDRMEQRIDVLGLQEEFDVFCADLEATFGWDLGPPVRMNRTQAREVPASLREQIRVDNRFDVELYAAAEELWTRRHPTTRPDGPGR